MNVRQAAEHLEISTVAVYRLIKRGTLTPTGTNPVTLDSEEVEAYGMRKAEVLSYAQTEGDGSAQSLGGRVGGHARKATLSRERATEIAVNAGSARAEARRLEGDQ